MQMVYAGPVTLSGNVIVVRTVPCTDVVATAAPFAPAGATMRYPGPAPEMAAAADGLRFDAQIVGV